MPEIAEPITAITIGLRQSDGKAMAILHHMDGAKTEVERDDEGRWQTTRMIMDDPDNPGQGFVAQVEGELLEDPLEIAKGFLTQVAEAEVIELKDRSPQDGSDTGA